MALTLVNARTMLGYRVGSLLGSDYWTFELGWRDVNFYGALSDAVGRGLRQAGYTVADPVTPADADVAAVDSDDLDRFLDLASLSLLEVVWSTLTSVDITVGPRSEKLSQLADRVQKRMESLRKSLADQYGYGLPELQAGYIRREFAEHGD